MLLGNDCEDEYFIEGLHQKSDSVTEYTTRWEGHPTTTSESKQWLVKCIGKKNFECYERRSAARFLAQDSKHEAFTPEEIMLSTEIKRMQAERQAQATYEMSNLLSKFKQKNARGQDFIKIMENAVNNEQPWNEVSIQLYPDVHMQVCPDQSRYEFPIDPYNNKAFASRRIVFTFHSLKQMIEYFGLESTVNKKTRLRDGDEATIACPTCRLSTTLKQGM